MDVNEILLKILRGHWRLLVVCLVLPPLVVGWLVWNEHPTYTSSVRIQGGTVLPGSDTEADAMLNLVKGVATSESVVQAALDAAHVHSLSATDVAANVDVTRLGSSTVDDLTVTGRDRADASAVADALAAQVVSYLNNAGDERTQNLLAGLTDRQKQLIDQRQQIASQLPLKTDPVTVANLAAELAGIDQQLSDLNSTIRELQLAGTSASGSSGAAGIVSPAISLGATSRHLAADIGLAVVAGLVSGLLLATLAETVRPRLPGGSAFAREVGVPLIGSLNLRRRGRAGRMSSRRRRRAHPGFEHDGPAELLLALRAAATRAQVDRVLLTGPAAPGELAAVAERLDELLHSDPAEPRSSNDNCHGNGNGNGRATAEAVAGTAATSGRYGGVEGGPRWAPLTSTLLLGMPTPTLRSEPTPGPLVVCPLDDYHAGPHDRVGLLPVVPRFAAQRSVRWLEDFAGATGWPVLGALALDDRSPRRLRTHPRRETRP